MKFRFLSAIAVVFVVLGAAASGQQPGPQAVRSPEVSADRRVTFRIAAPKATEVRLTCECVNGAQAMAKDDKGIWSLTLGPFEPDIYEYEFTVDGVTILDPRNEKVKYNGRPSTISSLARSPGRWAPVLRREDRARTAPSTSGGISRKR